jgi:hypothetical protein
MELTADDRLAIAELCARACHALDFNDPDGFARHWTANIVISPTETGAKAASYTMHVTNDAESRQVVIAIAGTYQDVFEKTESGWLFASRTVTDDL